MTQADVIKQANENPELWVQFFSAARTSGGSEVPYHEQANEESFIYFNYVNSLKKLEVPSQKALNLLGTIAALPNLNAHAIFLLLAPLKARYMEAPLSSIADLPPFPPTLGKVDQMGSLLYQRGETVKHSALLGKIASRGVESYLKEVAAKQIGLVAAV